MSTLSTVLLSVFVFAIKIRLLYGYGNKNRPFYGYENEKVPSLLPGTSMGTIAADELHQSVPVLS